MATCPATSERSGAREIVASLSGFSAQFLYLERKELPLHTLKVFELRVPTPPSNEQIFTAAERVVDLLAPLRWQLCRIRYLAHPHWRERATVDVRSHVRWAAETIACEADLDRMTGRLASQPLPVDTRLWDVTVAAWVSDPSRLVLVVRLHHALADGQASENMLEHLVQAWDDGPRMESLPAGAPTTVSERIRRRLRAWAGLPRLIAQSVRGWIRSQKARAAYRGEPRPAALFDAPKTSLDRPGGGQRTFHHFELSFAEIAEVKRAHACTVGDVLLTLVGAGMRRYFAMRGESLSAPLVAGVPVAVGGGSPPGRLWGNRLSHMPVSLRTDVDDDTGRLLEVARASRAAKAIHAALGANLIRAWAEFTVRSVLRWIFAVARRVGPPPINIIVSNVPGPREAIRIGGVQLARLFSVGPVLDRIGLNITAWSYDGRLAVSILANAANADDLTPIPEGMRRALQRLLQDVQNSP